MKDLELERSLRVMKIGMRPDAVRRRALLIARERALSEIDVARLLKATRYMKSKSLTWRSRGGLQLVDWGARRGISLDWLLCGDIRSFALMTRYPERYTQ